LSFRTMAFNILIQFVLSDLRSTPVGFESSNASPYLYGPSIVLFEGKYYQFYCSPGGGSSWDYIRLQTSTDGLSWSTPSIILQPQNGYDMESVCDPSVINFHGVWYLYHTCINTKSPPDGYANNRICVSLSDSITGPYYTKTEPVIQDLTCPGTGPYCVGQPSALVVNNTVYVYYTNQKGGEPGPNPGYIYLATSTDGLNFKLLPNIIYSQRDVDVKYNLQSKQFLMIQSDVGSTVVTWSTSSDGINFLPYDINRNIITNPNLPNGGSNNNPGIAGLPDGTIGSGATFSAYGSSLSANWGDWLLYRTNIVLNPGSEDCSTCVGSNGCDYGCSMNTGHTQIGTCVYPGAPPGPCCSCTSWSPGLTCGQCAPSGCVAACRGAGYVGGICEIPGSTNSSACCACVK